MKLITEFLITSLLFTFFFIFYASGAFMVLIPIVVVCVILKIISHMPFMKKYYNLNTISNQNDK